MKDFLVKLNDLPDEILIHICRSLYNVDVLYSLVGVNQRFNRIACDPIFTTDLCLLHNEPIISPDLFLLNDNSNKKSTSSLPGPMLDRLCSTILPGIGHQVKSLHVEAISMDRILRVTNYPQLFHLSLHDLDSNTVRSLLADENSLIHAFRNQISSLFINFIHEHGKDARNDVYTSIFTQVLTQFTDLCYLKFNPTSYCYERLRFYEAPTIISSTLVELHVELHDLLHCVYLLNGCFDQLRIFYADVLSADRESVTIDNRKLPNLQVFSLYCEWVHEAFETSVVPLLRRMINVRELDLTIALAYNNKCIDINVLNKDIVTHMPQLNKFTFNIYSKINHRDPDKSILYEHNQQMFEYFYRNQVSTCVNHFPENQYTQCHIYSYPYRLNFYKNITNHFPGGLFPSVTVVSLYDEHPFEYEFFLQIAHSFPLMKTLSIMNEKPPNAHYSLSLIEYPNLTSLDLYDSHDDYVELFVFGTKVVLPNNIRLLVEHEAVRKVTNNFTRYKTRNNCAKFAPVILHVIDSIDERIKNYFPCVYV